MKESLCILVVLMAIVLQSCSHDRRLTRRPGKRKPQTVDQVKTSNVPSEEWEIVAFGYGEMGYQTEDGDVKIKGDYSFCRKFNDGYASVRDKSQTWLRSSTE